MNARHPKTVCGPTEAMRLPIREVPYVRSEKFLKAISEHVFVLTCALGLPTLYEKRGEVPCVVASDLVNYLVTEGFTVEQLALALYKCELSDLANKVLSKTAKYMRGQAPPSFEL